MAEEKDVWFPPAVMTAEVHLFSIRVEEEVVMDVVEARAIVGVEALTITT